MVCSGYFWRTFQDCWCGRFEWSCIKPWWWGSCSKSVFLFLYSFNSIWGFRHLFSGIDKWVFVQELSESAEHLTKTLPLVICHSSENDDEQVFLLCSLFYNVYLNESYSQFTQLCWCSIRVQVAPLELCRWNLKWSFQYTCKRKSFVVKLT